jgi:hypothetical protein
MAGLIKRKVWDRVLRSTLLPPDTIFQTRFHYKIKRKGGKFEKCKVRLVVRGDRMTKKDEWIFLRLLHRANCSTVMAKTERFTFPPRPAILKTPHTATSLSGLFTACPALPVLGLRP